jgi:hypothetical protein
MSVKLIPINFKGYDLPVFKESRKAIGSNMVAIDPIRIVMAIFWLSY